MIADRTEELALAGQLPISVGGRTVVLRTLNLDESEDWLAELGRQVAGFEIPESDDAFAQIAQAPAKAMLELVVAYDLDGVLGPGESLRKRMTQRELYDAVQQMVTAEAPFVRDVRSVAEAFGPQLRAVVTSLVMAVVERSQQASNTNGRSPIGDSSPRLSIVDSPGNSSRSSGGTVSEGSSASGPKRS